MSTGELRLGASRPCPECLGTGQRRVSAMLFDEVDCWTCEGSGRLEVLEPEKESA